MKDIKKQQPKRRARYLVHSTNYKFNGKFYAAGSEVGEADPSFGWAQENGYLKQQPETDDGKADS